MTKKQAHELFEKLGGRKGIAERVLEIAKEIVECNSYKRATAGAGQIALLSLIADKGDCYWSEINNRGHRVEEDFIVRNCKKPKLTSEGHLDWEKTHAE